MKALNDKLMLTDVITHLKGLMTLYGVGFKHSNCQKMRDLMMKLSGRMGELQFQVFEYMNKHGMYPVENAEPAKIKTVLATHKGMANAI